MNRILLCIILTAVAVAGQQMAEAPEFDAASIKPSPADARGGGFNMSPGHLNGKNDSLKDLVRFAYDIHDYQLSGGAGWMDGDRYEVTATFPAATTNADRARMLQSLLRTRFGLAIHRESKEISGYVLTTGKSGHKLHPAGQEPPGMLLGRSASTGQRTLNASQASVSSLAGLLADVLGRPVEDRTGLTGIFDFSMEWTPDPSTDSAMGKGRNQEAPDYAQTGPSIFTAIQESLGLRLESGKTSVEVIVIDRAEKPSAN